MHLILYGDDRARLYVVVASKESNGGEVKSFAPTSIFFVNIRRMKPLVASILFALGLFTISVSAQQATPSASPTQAVRQSTSLSPEAAQLYIEIVQTELQARLFAIQGDSERQNPNNYSLNRISAPPNCYSRWYAARKKTSTSGVTCD